LQQLKAEARQAYGLGKLVRKVTKAVKKVLKSDIGKAAFIAAAIIWWSKTFRSPYRTGFKKFSFGAHSIWINLGLR
jgi:hypothetical protein